MKLIILISIFIYSIGAFGQTQNATTIKLSTGDCRSYELYSWKGADSIFFYKLPEDTLVYKIIPRQYRQWPIKIENAQIGNYKLKYKNEYDQEVIEQITLSEQPINSVVVCPDKLLKYPQNTIVKLQEKDTISINFHSQGCFHTDLLKLTITKENGRFIARLYSVNWYYAKKKGTTIMQYKDGLILKTAILTDQNIQDFIRFENELNYAKDGGCTTTDSYNIRSKYLNIEKKDGSCTWNGFYYLRKSFFGDN